MKRGLGTAGFTIIETMVVLTVTAGLFMAIVLSQRGQHNRDFELAANDFKSQLVTEISNVQQGYFPSMGNFKCEAMGNTVQITPGAAAEGTNGDCVYLGDIMQFLPGNSSTNDKYTLYPVAGLRTATTLASASPTTIPSSATTVELDGNLHIAAVKAGAGNVGALGFFSGLGTISHDTVYTSGTQTIATYPITGSSLGSPSGLTTANIKNSTPLTSSGAKICLQAGRASEWGLITISGASGGTLDVTLDIMTTANCGL